MFVVTDLFFIYFFINGSACSPGVSGFSSGQVFPLLLPITLLGVWPIFGTIEFKFLSIVETKLHLYLTSVALFR